MHAAAVKRSVRNFEAPDFLVDTMDFASGFYRLPIDVPPAASAVLSGPLVGVPRVLRSEVLPCAVAVVVVGLSGRMSGTKWLIRLFLSRHLVERV
jgi:hypothetical protein